MPRYFGPIQKKGAAGLDDPDLLNLSKLLIGQLMEQHNRLKVPSLAAERTIPAGTVRARLLYGKPVVEIIPNEQYEGPELEEAIAAFLGSPDGLRAYSISDKVLNDTLSGIGGYELDAVNDLGLVAWMTGNGIVVRIDLSARTAFGYAYSANTLHAGDVIAPGIAVVTVARLSPDGKSLLLAIDATGDNTGGATIVINEALGGFQLALAETLVAKRPPIRMSFRPQVFCFGPDGRFYLGTTLDSDPGDVPSIVQANSQFDYVSQFSAEGVLLASRQIHDFGFAPGTGFNRKHQAMAVNPQGTRLYVLKATPTTLLTIDLKDPALPILSTFAVANLGRDMSVNADGTRLLLLHSGSISEFDISLDMPILLQTFVSTNFDTSPVVSSINSATTELIQNGVKSRHGNFDPRRFVLNNAGAKGVLYAYLAIAEPPVFEYALDDKTVGNRYRMANIGTRRKRTHA